MTRNILDLFAANKLEASMCYVRGQAHMKLGDTVKAKACFKEALLVDVKCYNVSKAVVLDIVSEIELPTFARRLMIQALDALLSYNMFEEHLGKIT